MFWCLKALFGQVEITVGGLMIESEVAFMWAKISSSALFWYLGEIFLFLTFLLF